MNRVQMKCLVAFITFTFLLSAAVLCRTTFQVSRYNACPPQDSKFRTLVERSVEQCVDECVRKKSCKVVGYKNLLRLCELHTFSSSPYVADNHCILIKSEDMNGPPQKCNCGEWMMCSDATASNTGNCPIEECEPLSTIKNGKYLGNKNAVGSKKAVMCNPRYIEKNNIKSVTCLTNGTWSSTASCVPLECPSNDGGLNLTETFKLQFHQTQMTQLEAAEFCEGTIDGSLVMLDESWKMNYVTSVLTHCEGFHYKYWTDGSKTAGAQEWKFSNENIFPNEDGFWSPGQPSSDANKDLCVRVTPNGYNDRGCSVLDRFICEKN